MGDVEFVEEGEPENEFGLDPDTPIGSMCLIDGSFKIGIRANLKLIHRNDGGEVPQQLDIQEEP